MSALGNLGMTLGWAVLSKYLTGRTGRAKKSPQIDRSPVRTCRSPQACAVLVRRAAAKVRRRAESAESRREGAVRMLRNDARDMLEVAQRIARGDKAGALDKTAEMDTDARDEIPLAVYCWLDPKSLLHRRCVR